jgi:N,N'-diacetylchitobiose transport system permease protein
MPDTDLTRVGQTAPSRRNGGAVAKSRRPRRPSRPSSWLTPVVLLLPAAVVLGIVLAYPLVMLGIISFQDFGLQALFTGTNKWAGLANYFSVLRDPEFAVVVVRTLVFTIALVAGCVGIGMVVSEIMMRVNRPTRLCLNIIMIVAWAIPTVASTLVWKWLFQPLYGVINWVLTRIGIFGDFTTHSWVATPLDVFLIVWILLVWQSVPFVAFTLYAGQSQIPGEYYEAAKLDGASGWRIYRSVTLPFLRPMLYLVMILSVIWNFNAFNQIWIFSKGGPNGGSTTLAIWAFQKAFASNSFGEGAAIAVLILIMLMIVTSFYVRRLVRSGEEL